MIVLGLDLDNTLVEYGALFRQEALERGLVMEDCPPDKTSVRDRVRRLERGEDLWQQLQALVYGERIARAPAAPGVEEFLAWAARTDLRLFISSHKTRHARGAPSLDLRRAAMDWLEARGFLDPGRSPLTPALVRFHDTRKDKLLHIAQSRATHFVDDLPDVLLSPHFPATTRPILYLGATGSPPEAYANATLRHFSHLPGLLREPGHAA